MPSPTSDGDDIKTSVEKSNYVVNSPFTVERKILRRELYYIERNECRIDCLETRRVWVCKYLLVHTKSVTEQRDFDSRRLCASEKLIVIISAFVRCLYYVQERKGRQRRQVIGKVNGRHGEESHHCNRSRRHRAKSVNCYASHEWWFNFSAFDFRSSDDDFRLYVYVTTKTSSNSGKKWFE